MNLVRIIDLNNNTGLPTKDDTVRFLRLMITYNWKLVSFFPKPLNQPLEDYIQGRRLYYLIVDCHEFHVVFSLILCG